MTIKIRDGGAWVDVGGSGDATVPSGGIIMWSGSIASIPSGWALCNGSNGTPDLRDRFIVGASNNGSNQVTFNADTGAISGSYSVGVTGGEVAHQLTVAEMPSHLHGYGDETNQGTGGGQGGGGADTGSTTKSKTTDTRGSNDYHENRPPYYALAFIMKT